MFVAQSQQIIFLFGVPESEILILTRVTLSSFFSLSDILVCEWDVLVFEVETQSLDLETVFRRF